MLNSKISKKNFNKVVTFPLHPRVLTLISTQTLNYIKNLSIFLNLFTPFDCLIFIYYLFMLMCMCVPLSVCMPHTCRYPEARRGLWTPWSQSHRQL